MGVTDEARAELPSTAFVEEMYVQGCKNEKGHHHSWPSESRPEFRRWLAQQAYRKPEAAPSDTDREAWRKYANIIGIDPHYPGVIRGAFMAGRTSQPVQVEVTDDMVERAARVLYDVQPGVSFGTWNRVNGYAPGDKARAVLSAALGGGDHD